IHPPSDYEESAKPYLDDFISGLTGPPYRSANPYYSTIVLGDFNALNFTTLNKDPSKRIDWPSGTKMVFQPTDDVMQVSLGNTSGSLSPVHNLQLDLGLALPTLVPCRPQDGSVFYKNKSFSDHCGLLVRFSE